MAPCKLPCAIFIDRKIACQTSFLTIYSIIFYGNELTCHEAMDLLVCFNRHASFLGLSQGGHIRYHVIFIYIQNRLAMMNKMAARVLAYELGSLSYV